MIYDVTIDGASYRLDLNLDRAGGRWRRLVAGRDGGMDAGRAQPYVLSFQLTGTARPTRRTECSQSPAGGWW